MEFSTADLAMFASGTEVFMAILDEDGVVLKSNNKWFGKLLIEENDFIGQNLTQFLQTDGKDDLEQSIAELKTKKQICHHLMQFVDRELKSYTFQLDLTYNDGKIYLVGFDVTDHYQEHQSLQEMSAIAQVGAWYHDPIRNQNFWSDECYRIHDLPLGSEISARKALDFYLPVYRKEIDRLIERLYAKGEAYEFSGEIITSAGNKKWIRTRAQPSFHDGKLIFIYGITSDQTQLHNNLLQLQREAETRQLALKGIKSGLFDYSIPEDKVFFSLEFKRMLGFPEEMDRVSDSVLRDLIHPDDKSQAIKAMDWGVKHSGDHYYNRYRLRHKDGTYKYYEVHGWKSRNKEGITTRMIGNLIDVHESVLVEQEKAKVMNSLEAMVDNGFMYSLLLDKNGVILLADKKSLDVIASEYRLDPKKEKVQYKDVMPSAFKESFLRDFGKALEGNTVRKEVERPLLDGSMQWLDIMYRPIRNEDGEIVSVLTNGVDISKHKKAEFSIKEAEMKARELSELKSKVLSNLSHEIRTPLNGIMGVNELLKKYCVDEEELELLARQKESSLRLLKTLTDMVHLSDRFIVEENLNLVQLEANEIVRMSFGMYDHLARLRDLNYELELPEKTFMIKVDKELFLAALGAIINNALKYTEKGGVSVVCENHRKDGNLTISVTDTGKGIDTRDFGKIFDEESGKFGLYKKYEESGISLGSSKKYIESMGGTIRVTSTLNKGSEFVVTMPSEP